MLKVKDIDQTQAPLLDHLVELRTRLLRCIVALGVAFAVCFYFAEDIFAILVRPLAARRQGAAASRPGARSSMIASSSWR